MRYALFACAALLLSACASNPAADPLQIRLNDMDTRLGNVERVVSNQSLVDMSRRIDALEAQLREQHGSIEVMQNSAESARKAQRDLYADLDRRLTLLENAARSAAAAQAGGGASGESPTGTAAAAGTVGAAGAAGAASAAGATAADDQAAYSAAFDQLKAGSYGDAIRAFQDFMTRYPSSSLLDNAQYWIGEGYYVTRDYDAAAAAFRAVGERWPDSRKAPDALLKLGYTLYEQKQLAEARTTLNQVVARYPGSDAARLAQQRLGKFPPEGR